MRIESPAGMEQRLSNPSRPPRQTPPSHTRKNKRRSGRRSNPLDTIPDTWPNVSQSSQEGGLAAGMEYPPQQMVWQPTDGVPQNMSSNGQRLFTAMSDPSVCGYSPIPVTYAMQPVSLPAMYRMYQPMPVPNIRTVHSRQRHRCNKHLASARPNANNNVVNGYGNLQENGVLEPAVHIALQNGDYASLPPTANKDSGINGDELNSEHRRYSDPGLGPAGNSAHSDSDDSDSVESGSSITTISRSNKLVLSLIEQMTELKKCNSQLFKELSETKSNLENVKTKLAQCNSTPADYKPGMLSELVREIREANRNCEEGLVLKVKSMLEEKCAQQSKEVDEIKNQLVQLMKEKEESDQRVAKLEEEVTALKLSATNEGRELAVFEEENLALRRELQEARASRTLAENHAAKCVNLAVPRSVTPVTFDTPSLSTPVRTALTELRLLFPPVSTAPHTTYTSSVLSPHSAKVAPFDLVFDVCENSATDSGPVSASSTRENARSETSLSYQTAITCTNDDATVGVRSWKGLKNQSSEIIELLLAAEKMLEFSNYLVSSMLNETRKIDTTRNDDKLKPSTTTEEEKRLSIGTLEEPPELLGICEAALSSITEEVGAEDLGSFKDLEEDVSDKLDEFHNQQDSFSRKPRSVRKLFSESDGDQDPTPLDPSEGNCDTTNEDEDRFSKDGRTSQAITDVPDVVVIGGGSIVPKDLCSTRTLISRIQTAPSRATYTTAYI